MATLPVPPAQFFKLDLTPIPSGTALKRVDGRAPETTNIRFLGITTAAAKLLTPAAAKLTKADLEHLAADPAKTEKSLGLTVEDVNSIKTAFSMPMIVNTDLEITVKCCCCTPCCCAAAVPRASAIC